MNEFTHQLEIKESWSVVLPSLGAAGDGGVLVRASPFSGAAEMAGVRSVALPSLEQRSLGVW